MSLPRLSLLLALAGAALAVLGVVVGGDTSWVSHIEGVSFTRAAGTPAYSSAFDWSGGPALLSRHDGNLWLGAGIVLLLAAAGAMFAHRAGLRLVRTHD